MLFAVPLPRRAVGTVPLVRLLALRVVRSAVIASVPLVVPSMNVFVVLMPGDGWILA